MWVEHGKTMINQAFGNVKHTTYKNADDWGMVNMTASFTHMKIRYESLYSPPLSTVNHYYNHYYTHYGDGSKPYPPGEH